MAEIQAGDGGGRPDSISIPSLLSLFTPQDLVIFPGLIVPLSVDNENTIQMINDVMQRGPRIIGCFLRKPVEESEPEVQIFETGTALIIHRMLRMPDGSIRMIVQGIERIKLIEVVHTTPYLQGKVEVLEVKARKTVRLEALLRALREEFEEMADLTPNMPDEFKAAVQHLDDPGGLVDLIAANLNFEPLTRQQILQTIKIPERIDLLRNFISREIQILQIGTKLHEDTREEIEKSQREYFLRQQLSRIKQELGEGDEDSAEVMEWRRRIDEANMPEHVLQVVDKEIERLERINPASAEYSVVTSYLDWLISLPWTILTEDHLDLKEAKRILDEDHYGLDDIKDRILEVLAVRKLKPDAQGPILCFVGPPGVGKTSLGQSIARAMGRNFIRVSLGGVRDEAEIRGHRRTYVGAMPGRILQKMKNAGSSNPIFMLDEVDKLVSDFRGDPSSALLEVLDPAQNSTFSDHYIEIEFDLSSVFFITTANYLDLIPAPLLDRMEVINLAGYIAKEKVEIARKYLVPRQIEANGLKRSDVRFTRSALDSIINYYTREAGVRNLERTIGAICRKIARRVAEGKRSKSVSIKPDNLADYLGPQKITPIWVNRKARVGVANGLAYTPYGGSVLQVETALMPGKGNLKITGQLGDVMKESASIALSWIRAHTGELSIPEKLLDDRDLHLHVPEGATPKDGPSAGIAMCASLASRFSGRAVRSDLAMTGEITLTGQVLPIGGLREKLVAANRARLKHVLIPWDNRKDLEEVPEEVCSSIEIHPVKSIQEVLEFALKLKPGGRDGGGKAKSDGGRKVKADGDGRKRAAAGKQAKRKGVKRTKGDGR